MRLLHRRRGWTWAAVISVVAWLTAAGLLGSLAPDGGSGAGVAVGSIFVLLLTVAAIVALVASVTDTVRLRRRDPGVRQRAAGLTAHHPARAHAYSYPPRHRFTWVRAGLRQAGFPAAGRNAATPRTRSWNSSGIP